MAVRSGMAVGLASTAAIASAVGQAGCQSELRAGRVCDGTVEISAACWCGRSGAACRVDRDSRALLGLNVGVGVGVGVDRRQSRRLRYGLLVSTLRRRNVQR